MADSEGLRLFLALTLGTLALLLMAIAIIAFVLFYQRKVLSHQLELKQKDEAMQKELLRAAIQSQEDEQRRIARDLHDDLGPMLSAVKLKISQIGRRLDGAYSNMTELSESKEMLDVTIKQVRGMSHRLLPPILEDYGLVSAVENSCHKMSSVELEVDIKPDPGFKRMDGDTELALYRVIMELLNNVVKHSRATSAHVSFAQTANGYEIKVSDNGIGFDPDRRNPNAGLGLKNVQSRLSTINAHVVYKSEPGNTIAIVRPLS